MEIGYSGRFSNVLLDQFFWSYCLKPDFRISSITLYSFVIHEYLCLIVFKNARSEETNERIVGALNAEKDELEAALNREQIQTLELKQQLAEAETRNMDLTKVKQNEIICYFSFYNLEY